jgi:sterol desaturase/sphingolipid hydroxylase (fatty acid hydroxylase superfamily)
LNVFDYATLLISFVVKPVAATLLPLSSMFSLASLFSALSVAVAFLLFQRRPHKRSISYRVMLRVLFPSWWYRNASFKADVGFLLFSVVIFGGLFGWAMLSADFVSRSVSGALTNQFGAAGGFGLNPVIANAVSAFSIFIAYELAYWFDHYLKHRVPLLWEFHKVHHTAEVLSPLTNFRVHPVDSVIFGNIMAVAMGTTHGVMTYLEFSTAGGAGVSVIAVAFMWALGHLHHSHFWISTTGPLGCVILSPAHHQLHHSDNPKHFNKNFGAFLSVWDWMFGTLHLPDRRQQHLNFGVGHRDAAEHTVMGALITPFVLAWRHARRVLSSRGQRRAAKQNPRAHESLAVDAVID